MIYYEFSPLDTLFFRGTVPMEAGQLTAVSLFPPPVSVFTGAIRTAVLKENNISFVNYKNGNDGNSEIINLIGKAGEPAPFYVTLFFIKKDGRFFIQAPSSWYLDSDKKPVSKADYTEGRLTQAFLADDYFSKLNVTSSEHDLPFVKADHEVYPISSLWIDIDFFSTSKKHLAEKDFLLNAEVYTIENRTGVGLDDKRHTVEGQLYTAAHIRLLDGITFGVGVSKETGLKEKGILSLGGENRICTYNKIAPSFDFKEHNSGFYLSTAPVKAADPVNAENNILKLFSSKKLVEIAGWDLHKGFHKPSETWIPAGSVFTEKINEACISLPLIGQ